MNRRVGNPKRSLIFENKNTRGEEMNNIIPALDVNRKKAFELVTQLENVSHLLAGLKVGFKLLWENTLAVITDLKEVTDLPIIFDGQKIGTDVPHIVEEQVDLLAAAGVDQIIICPLGSGDATLAAFYDRCKEYDVVPVCVVKMTHPGAERYLSSDASRLVLQDALEIGIRDFVYPATKPAILQKHSDDVLRSQKDITIKATGFKAQGGSLPQLKRLGVSEFIVGRAVYASENPPRAVVELSKEVNE